MPLTIINIAPLQAVRAAHVTQFYDLLTGVTTDQPVTLKNVVRVGGNQSTGSTVLRLDGVAAQTGKMLELFTLAGDTQPAIAIDKAGIVSWGPGGGSALDVTLARLDTNGLLLSKDFSLTDQGSDPAAPGAGLTRIFSKAGVVYARAGAAGTAQPIASDIVAGQVFER